jgi:hypothetical protein
VLFCHPVHLMDIIVADYIISFLFHFPVIHVLLSIPVEYHFDKINATIRQ